MRQRFNKFRRYLNHNRFIVTVAGAIVVSLLLVTVSIAIYVRDGAILLDLSRPSYAPVREKIKKGDITPAFSSNGKLDLDIVKDFRTQLKQQTSEINKLGSFDGAAINDEALLLKP